ncbi:hypothetical protein [Shewanella sp. GD03713]|uniref:hypothetical protein n=1 Tax=Shewanella sp. GD03713 TaxID=2975372 RepID=UPI000B343740|nr:hypothetical protein [Shewanella sp. GD03713]MDH1472753.1 hypothetical protein [Shewanella sp. GD03713]QXN27351.1 hypothetical protein KVP08_021880 [Shewanella putrefaciens]
MSQEREDKARKYLKNFLREYFEVKEEVTGTWPLDDRPLRLDLLLLPKQKALDLGFDVEAVGVEIKDPQSKESVKKLLDCVMQSYTYTFCEFDGVRPAFVLIYPEIEKFFEEDWVNKYGSNMQEAPTSREKRLLRRLMQRANVGELKINENQVFIFDFGAGPFFRSDKGRSKIKGIGLNRYVGSQKN